MSRVKRRVLVERSNEFELVSVGDLLFQLRAEEEDYPINSIERDGLSIAIDAATDWLEDATGQTFVNATFDVYFDNFYAGLLELSSYPLRELVSIDYINSDGSWQSFDISSVDVDLFAIRPTVSATWPETKSVSNAVKVRIKAGYEAEKELPKQAKVAVLMLACHLHQNSSATSAIKLEQVPLGVKNFSDMLRVSWL